MKKAEPEDTLEVARKVYCARHGHSRVLDYFFGYHTCGRCGDQVGDSIGSIYSNDEAVYVHHIGVWTLKKERFKGCRCPENAEKLTEHDLALLPEFNSFGYGMRPPWKMKKEAADEEVGVDHQGKGAAE